MALHITTKQDKANTEAIEARIASGQMAATQPAADFVARTPVPPFLADNAPQPTEAPRLHVVSLSGGLSSAAVAERVIARYGKENVRLWFADTSAEHPDLYKLIDFIEQRFGVPVIHYRDGRDPYQVAEDASVIPNTKIAPCTRVLKIEPAVKYVQSLLKDGRSVTMHIGYNWTEPHRKPATLKNWNAIGVDCEFPLIDWQPTDLRTNEQIARGWGIEVPALYKLGYSHNNCHGECVKQGVIDWVRTLRYFPERFAKRETWETAQRQKPGREHFAICRETINGVVTALPLAEIRRRVESGQVFTSRGWKSAPASGELLPQIEQVDNIACVCDAGDIAPVLFDALQAPKSAFPVASLRADQCHTGARAVRPLMFEPLQGCALPPAERPVPEAAPALDFEAAYAWKVAREQAYKLIAWGNGEYDWKTDRIVPKPERVAA